MNLESGYLDKMKVAPIYRSSILLGKVFSDGFRILVQSIIILVLALVVGVDIVTGIGRSHNFDHSCYFRNSLVRYLDLRCPVDQELRDHVIDRSPHHISIIVPINSCDAEAAFATLGPNGLRL